MKAIPLLTIAAIVSLALGACDRPGTKHTAAPNTTSTTTTTISTAPTNPAQSVDTTSPNTPATTASTAPTSSDMPATSSTAATSTAATGTNSSNVVADTIVTGKVKAAIAADSGMKDSDISVKTENGIVTLTGNVKSPDQVTLAAALAQRQEGVSRVENQVAVK
jgi:hyperosmotically inducible protein